MTERLTIDEFDEALRRLQENIVAVCKEHDIDPTEILEKIFPPTQREAHPYNKAENKLNRKHRKMSQERDIKSKTYVSNQTWSKRA